MSGSGSEAVLYDIDGDPMAVENGAVIPALTSILISGGSDGTNARFIKVDSSGNQVMIGLGTAGTPTGGVITIQGDPSGTAVPISGTVTANAGSGNFSVVQATAALLNATVTGIVTANIGTSGALALDATLAKLTITPGTAIGSNTLAMIGGHVTTVSPTYTNGNINQLSLTTAGALRIDGSGVVHPVSQSGTWTVQQGTPPWSVAGTAADGAAVSGNPVRIGGSDGTNTQDILTDTTGRQIVVGAAADGTAVTGNPVLMGGQDGINVQSIATDGYGRVQVTITGSTSTTQVEGRAADGTTPIGNPVYIAGYDGTDIQSILTDTQGRIVIAPSGASTESGFSFGEIILASTTVTAIRSTTYTEPSSGAQRSMASSNVNDTSAGTGARTVRITYYALNAGVVTGPFLETITLNGTSNVNTVATNICYIEEMEVMTVGSGGVNAGTITLFGAAGGGGGTVWTIAIGANRTQGSHHYVPSSSTCFVTTFSGGIKGADTSGFILRAKDPTSANSAEFQISDLLRAPSSGNTPIRVYGTPIQVPGPARITAFAVPDSTSSRTYYASFDFYEE